MFRRDIQLELEKWKGKNNLNRIKSAIEIIFCDLQAPI